MENKRLVWPDFLRIISIFCVILIHVSAIGIRDYTVGSSVWIWSVVLNSVSRWAVPLFFMISGMFFLDPEKSIDIKKFFSKNVLRIVLCIIVWGFFYSFLDQYLYGTISWKSILIAIYGILTDNTGYHLWFLYTLLILYISTPFLRIFTEHATKRQLDYALLIWFLLAAAVPATNSLVNELFHISNLFPYQPIAIAGYGGYYLLGYRLKKYPLEKKWLTVSSIAGFISLTAMPVGNLILSFKKDAFCEVFSAPIGVCCCIFSIALFSLVSHWNLKANWISWIGKRVFGIYLTHVFFVSIAFHVFNITFDAFFALISIIGTGIIIFIMSLLTSWILGLIPGIRKVV